MILLILIKCSAIWDAYTSVKNRRQRKKIVVTKFRRVVTSESEGGVANREVHTAGFWGAANVLFSDNSVNGTSMFYLPFL